MKKDYYIQGDPDRADKIKDAFEAKGIDTTGTTVGNDDFLYYSSNGLLYFEEFSNTLLNIFKTHPNYQELELPTKPKFKIGDWIILNDGSSYVPIQVYGIKKDRYIVTNMLGSKGEVMLTCQDKWHLWEITDAKDGDVLVVNGSSKQYKWIGIFKAHTSDTSFSSHCHYNCGMCEFVTDIARCTKHGTGKYSDIRPATKEESDLLFAKMREAGYEWDTDKKELHKIIEPKFNVGDWIVHTNGSSYVPIQVYGIKNDRYLVTNMLGSKGKVMLEWQDNWCPWTIQDAKDGDVLVYEDYIFIFKYILHGGVHLYCHYNIDDEEFDYDIPDAIIGNIHDKGAHFQPATKEQHILLFAKMKEAGYDWDIDKKELKKIPKHYDISNFSAGMPVLVRADNNCRWDYSVFSRITGNKDWQFAVCNGISFTQCIPFEGNEHLLGATDPCDEQYINW